MLGDLCSCLLFGVAAISQTVGYFSFSSASHGKVYMALKCGRQLHTTARPSVCACVVIAVHLDLIFRSYNKK